MTNGTLFIIVIVLLGVSIWMLRRQLDRICQTTEGIDQALKGLEHRLSQHFPLSQDRHDSN